MKRLIPIFVCLLFVMASCARGVAPVVVDSVSKETEISRQASIDTILRYDSVFIEKAGDTIRETKYKYIYKIKSRTDTVLKTRVDSIPVPYEVVVYKEKGFFASLKNSVELIVTSIITLIAAAAVFCIFKKLRKRWQ